MVNKKLNYQVCNSEPVHSINFGHNSFQQASTIKIDVHKKNKANKQRQLNYTCSYLTHNATILYNSGRKQLEKFDMLIAKFYCELLIIMTEKQWQNWLVVKWSNMMHTHTQSSQLPQICKEMVKVNNKISWELTAAFGTRKLKTTCIETKISVVNNSKDCHVAEQVATG